MKPYEMNKPPLRGTPKSQDKMYNEYRKRGQSKMVNGINQSK